jgi:hypothetical protein
MAVLSARVADGAPAALSRWKTEELWSGARRASMAEYQGWIDRSAEGPWSASADAYPDMPRDSFYLAGIRKDGYREYGFR